MDSILSSISNSQPELYAILALLLYLGKKVYPLLKQNIVLKQSTLDCLIRIEQGIKDNGADTKKAFSDLASDIKTLLSKDDAIDLLLHRPKKMVVNGSGTITKQVV